MYIFKLFSWTKIDTYVTIIIIIDWKQKRISGQMQRQHPICHSIQLHADCETCGYRTTALILPQSTCSWDFFLFLRSLLMIAIIAVRWSRMRIWACCMHAFSQSSLSPSIRNIRMIDVLQWSTEWSMSRCDCVSPDTLDKIHKAIIRLFSSYPIYHWQLDNKMVVKNWRICFSYAVIDYIRIYILLLLSHKSKCKIDN